MCVVVVCFSSEGVVDYSRKCWHSCSVLSCRKTLAYLHQAQACMHAYIYVVVKSSINNKLRFSFIVSCQQAPTIHQRNQPSKQHVRCDSCVSPP